MEREIKFRCWHPKKKRWIKDFAIDDIGGDVTDCEFNSFSVEDGEVVLMQYTGLKDKNGKEIYEGDEIQYRQPYRTTQTHYGDNIPNGEYTEPMEPGIKTRGGIVIFKDGMFQVDGDEEQRFNESYPLLWAIEEWSLERIKDAISWTRETAGWFDDPEEGDLQYLIKECANLDNEKELIEYLSGVEVIGNIYENPELLNTDKNVQECDATDVK